MNKVAVIVRLEFYETQMVVGQYEETPVAHLDA